ncbi:MAG: hypothetical protein AAF687_02105 [Pseudomonadota bacterium]
MDSDLILIFGFILSALVVIGVSVNGIVSKATKYYLTKEERRTGSSAAPAEARELEERTDLIEDRLRVLERIATDRGQLLSDEIDALRSDTRALEQSEEAR